MFNKELLCGTREQIYLLTLVNKSSYRLEVNEWVSNGTPYDLKTNPETCTIDPYSTVVFEILNLDGLIAKDSTYTIFIIPLNDIMYVDVRGEGCNVRSGNGIIVLPDTTGGYARSMRVTVDAVEFIWVYNPELGYELGVCQLTMAYFYWSFQYQHRPLARNTYFDFQAMTQ